MFTQTIVPKMPLATAAQLLQRGTMNKQWRCLLIVDGLPKRIQQWQEALDKMGVESRWCGSLQEVAKACCCDYDFVIVDVEKIPLERLLRVVREKSKREEMPILVERSHLTMTPALAGVLPHYRAMPCGFAEIIKLFQHQFLQANKPQQAIRPYSQGLHLLL